jgi:ligand-binding sensor domain-containing protein
MVLHSNNGGLNWGNLGLADLEIYALALDSNATIYAGTNNGIYHYSAGGWAHLGLGGLAVTEVRSHPTEPGWLYAGTTNGLYTSHDAGQSWEAGPQHLNGLTVLSISFDPTNPDDVYISTKTHGVLRFHSSTIH